MINLGRPRFGGKHNVVQHDVFMRVESAEMEGDGSFSGSAFV